MHRCHDRDATGRINNKWGGPIDRNEWPKSTHDCSDEILAREIHREGCSPSIRLDVSIEKFVTASAKSGEIPGRRNTHSRIRFRNLLSTIEYRIRVIYGYKFNSDKNIIATRFDRGESRKKKKNVGILFQVDFASREFQLKLNSLPIYASYNKFTSPEVFF